MDEKLNWKDARLCTPEINELGCSEDVLVIRDCGIGTLPSYFITRYRPDGWGNNEKWLDQGSKGYRVVKWCYLPEL